MRRRMHHAAFPIHRHALPQMLVDAGLVALAYFLAFRLRFDSGLPDRYQQLFETTLPWVVVGSVLIFFLFGLYHKWWRYAGKRDYDAILKATATALLALASLVALIHPVKIGETPVGLPTGVVALHGLLMLALIAGSRFAVHTVFERPPRGFHPDRQARDVLIVGAGDGGRLVLREIIRNPQLGYRPVGFVDDDESKRGMRMASGLKVLGTTEQLARVLDEADPDEVLIAIPSAPGSLRGRVVSTCRKRSIPVRTLPTVFELLQTGGDVMRQVRDVQVEDVLGREPVLMQLESVGAYLQGRTVLVTGAGGSIGSELARQIARVDPRRLILLDHSEQALFDISRELQHDRHFRAVESVLADCKNAQRMRAVIEQYRPYAIFHAAAYKHVGLMQENPTEAVANNAFATRTVSNLAGELGVERFVLISTDKAVAPATVMGASKALAEWAVEAAGQRYPKTDFAAVRFGNVLGSSGSVVPIFRKQIERGGPVTVTDPAMTRYFMTIPEAVQLVIRAGALSGEGELFVLDMGEPVSILELAKDMIRLSGLQPEVDIAIEIVGASPGEKLTEQLFNDYESSAATTAEKILKVERNMLDPDWVDDLFKRLADSHSVQVDSSTAVELVTLAASRPSTVVEQHA